MNKCPVKCVKHELARNVQKFKFSKKRKDGQWGNLRHWHLESKDSAVLLILPMCHVNCSIYLFFLDFLSENLIFYFARITFKVRYL